MRVASFKRFGSRCRPSDVNVATTPIVAAGALPILVAYNIPQRDCGGYSGSNLTSAQAYRNWILALANGIGARRPQAPGCRSTHWAWRNEADVRAVPSIGPSFAVRLAQMRSG